MSAVLVEPIAVVVHATDPISLAGLLSQLRGRTEVRLLGDGESVGGAVPVIVAGSADPATLALVKAARRAGSCPAVLVLADFDDAAIMAAIEAGAYSLVPRDAASVGDLVLAIRSAHRGEGTLSPPLLGRLLHQVGRMQRDVLSPRGLAFHGLSTREIEVLRLVADGHDTAEVGRRLFLGDRTVKNVLHDITTRLNLRNRTHAVAYALRNGLI